MEPGSLIFDRALWRKGRDAWIWLSERERLNYLTFWHEHTKELRPQILPDQQFVEAIKTVIDAYQNLGECLRKVKGISSRRPITISDDDAQFWRSFDEEKWIHVLRNSYEKIIDPDSLNYIEMLDLGELLPKTSEISSHPKRKPLSAKDLMMMALEDRAYYQPTGEEDDIRDHDLANVYRFLEEFPFEPDDWVRREKMLSPFLVDLARQTKFTEDTLRNLEDLFSEYQRTFTLGYFRSCNALARTIIECCVMGLFPGTVCGLKTKGYVIWADTFRRLQNSTPRSNVAGEASKFWHERSSFIHWNEKVSSTEQEAVFRQLHDDLRKIVSDMFAATEKIP